MKTRTLCFHWTIFVFLLIILQWVSCQTCPELGCKGSWFRSIGTNIYWEAL